MWNDQSRKYLFFVLFPVLCKVFIIFNINWGWVIDEILILLAFDMFVNLFFRGFDLIFLVFIERNLDIRADSVNLIHSASKFIVEDQEDK